MDAFPSLKRNYLLNMMLTGGNIVFPMLVLAFAARVLGPAGLGSFYFAAGLATYFLTISGAALPIYGIREFGRLRGDRPAMEKLAGELAMLNLVLSLAATVIYVGVVLATPRFRAGLPMFLVVGCMIPLQALSADYVFQGLEEYGGLAFRSVLSKATTLILMLIFVRGPGDGLAYAAIFAASGVLAGTLGWLNLKRRLRLRLRGLDWRRHLRPLLPLFGFFLVASVYVNFDTVLLGMLSSRYEVGIYNIGVKTTRMALTLIAGGSMALVPRLAYYLERDRREEHLALEGRAVEWILFLSSAGAVVLAFAAPILMPLCFGAGFRDSISTVRITAPNVLVVSLSGFLGMNVLLPLGKESFLVWATLAGSAVSLLLGVLLVPRMGHDGSAVAWLCAETLVLALLIGISRRQGIRVPFFTLRNAAYPLCALLLAAPATAAAYAWGQSSPWVLAGLALGSVLYLAALARLRPDQVRELKALATKASLRFRGR